MEQQKKIETENQTKQPIDNQNKSTTFSLAGTVVGLIAVGIAVIHFFAGPIEKSPPIEETVADYTVKIKKAIINKVKGKTPENEARSYDADDMVMLATVGLGFIALVLGVIGFIKKEELRPSLVALGLGVGAMVFQFAVVVIGAFLGIMLLGVILSALGGA